MDLKIFEDDVGLGNTTDAHGGCALCNNESGVLVIVTNYDKPANSLLYTLVEDPGKNKVQAGYAAPGNPVLMAIESVGVTMLISAGCHFTGRTSRIGLRDTDRGFVPLQYAGCCKFFLRLAPVGHDRTNRPHICLDRNTAHRCAGLGHFFNDQDRLQITQALTTVGLRDCHSHEASSI